jgi:hypothetical protein
MLKYLPFVEIAKIYTASNLRRLFVAWQVKGTNIIFYTGHHQVITVPFEWFKGAIQPNFDDVEVTDYGQTVRLGEFEVGTDTILAAFGETND